jgi:uncharacterized iron-regulated membrane protein
MRFQVPQYIDVEDKIFGPFTVKQFIYLAGSAGVVFIFYSFLPLWLAILFAAPVIALGLALAFYKINNRPFIFVVESAIKYIVTSRLYIWKKREKPVQKKEGKNKEEASTDLFVPKLSDSKLKDLAWSLDIQESIYSDQDQR